MDEQEMTEQERHVAEALRYWLLAQRKPDQAIFHLSYMQIALEAAHQPESVIGVTREAHQELLRRGAILRHERCMAAAATTTHDTRNMLLGQASAALRCAGLEANDDVMKAMRAQQPH